MQQLDDTLSATNVASDPFIQMSDGGSVESRLEAMLEGADAPIEEAEVQTEDETTDQTPDEMEETPTDTEEAEEDEDESEEDEAEEKEEVEEDDDAIELDENQLAESLGLSEGDVALDDEGNTLIRTKIDGKVDFVPMSDLQASYQMQGSLDGKMKQAAETKKEFEAFKTAETEKLQGQIQDATALVVTMEQQLNAAVQNVDLESLRKNNPGEYAAMQSDIAQRKAQIDQYKAQVKSHLEKAQQEQAEKANESRQSYIMDQTEKLIESFPTWSDPETAKAGIQSFIPAAEAAGFSAEDVNEIIDHRMFKLLKLAAKGMSVGDPDPVKKKLKKVPKIIKPGARKPNNKSAQDRQAQQKRNALKQTGGTQEAASLIYSKLQ